MSGESYDPEPGSVAEQAKMWVDAVNSATGPSGGWRLQTVRYRARGGSSPDGEDCGLLPVRVRRFVSGCPWTLLDEVLRYLYRTAPYEGIIYNGIPVQGSYRPTKTDWTRDDQLLSPGERGSLGTYTLVQDLVEVSSCEDAVALPSGSSCQSAEETVWKWDADSVESVPSGCAPGVTWSIRAVQRNEDGTFDYQLVKTVAKTVEWASESAPALVECQADHVTEEWGWRNLYGGPVSGFEARRCGSDSAEPVSVPSSCSPSPGVRIEVQRQMNQDCTWDVTVRRRTAREISADWTGGTRCRPVARSLVRNSPSRPSAPVPSAGERVEASIRPNDDGTWDAEFAVTAPPPEVDEEWDEGTAVRPRHVHELRGQVSRPQVPSLSSLSAGEALEVSLSLNDDCTWDARFAVTAPRPRFSMDWTQGSQCRPENVSVRQSQEAAPDPSVFLPSAAGEVVSASVSMNDDGTYDWRAERRTAPPAESLAWGQGSACRPESVTLYQSWASAPPVPAPAVGRTVSASVRRNDDCTWDGTVTVAESAPDSVGWDEGSGTENVRVELRTAQRSVTVPGPECGKTVSASVSRNADCTYDVTTRVATPVRQDSGWVTWDSETVTSRGTYKYHHGVRSFSHLDEPPHPDAGSNVSYHDLRVDEFCKYSGALSYTDLYEWEENSSGDDGGIRNGSTAPVVTDVGRTPQGRPYYYTSSYSTIVFIGSGNEGTEADTLKNGWVSLGGHGGIRGYRSPAPEMTLHWGVPE